MCVCVYVYACVCVCVYVYVCACVRVLVNVLSRNLVIFGATFNSQFWLQSVFSTLR